MSAFPSISSHPAPRRAAGRDTATRGKQARSRKTHTEGILEVQQSPNSVMTLTLNDRDDPAEPYMGPRLMRVPKDSVRGAPLSLAGRGRYPGRGAGRTRRTGFSTPTKSLFQTQRAEPDKAPDLGHCWLPTYAPALPSAIPPSAQRPKPGKTPAPSPANCADDLSKVQRLPGPPPSHTAPASCPGNAARAGRRSARAEPRAETRAPHGAARRAPQPHTALPRLSPNTALGMSATAGARSTVPGANPWCLKPEPG